MMPIAAVLSGSDPAAELAETRELIHEVCREWDAGTLPLVEVRSRTTGAERCIAYRLTEPAGPMWGPMTRMFNRLVATDPTSQYGHHYATRQGVFSEAELAAADARYTRLDDGRIRITFPIRAAPEGRG